MIKILLVEDDELSRDMLSRRLARRGYQVLVAIHGNQGITLARSERPDLILLDMRLPGIDGWYVAQRLKAASETSAIPVIALTAHAVAGDRQRALQAGCDDYESKPVDLPRLLAKIELLLDKEKPNYET